MKVLVYAHRLEVGGTQTNAIELAAALRDLHGFDVTMFAAPGPMVELVREKRLRYIPAPDAYLHPSPARMRALRAAVRAERPDVIHVWDWWQCLDAYYAVHLAMRVPMVVSDMMMHPTRVLPKHLPTSFGTPELVDLARKAGRKRVELLVPPVDVHLNAPDVVNGRLFRQRLGIADSDILLVTVSRLSHWMKSESLIRTIDVVRDLGRQLPLRLIVVGDGAARSRLEGMAGETNAKLGRTAVTLTGMLMDPRPAYAAADIVVGMGGSALRGMAFGKAVVIVGERGFSAPFTPDTAESFYYKGIYGRGVGEADYERLAADIRGLAELPGRLAALGEFSRQFVGRRYSLETVCGCLADFLEGAVREVPRFHVAATDGLRTAAVYLRERGFLIPSRDPTPKQ